jgi:hypothetical protein
MYFQIFVVILIACGATINYYAFKLSVASLASMYDPTMRAAQAKIVTRLGAIYGLSLIGMSCQTFVLILKVLANHHPG